MNQPFLKEAQRQQRLIKDLQRFLQGKIKVSPEEFSRKLADSFCSWQKGIPRQETLSVNIPLSKSYSQWLKDGGDKQKYWPVHQLRKLLDKKGRDVFLRAVLHGSIATLDDTQGFSDMDLVFVVRGEVLKDDHKLREFKKLANQILALTFAFDPFMHHGPYYICEIDLKWYPQSFFPLVLFEYGVDLIDKPKEIMVRIRPSEDMTDQTLDMFERFFEKRSESFVIKDNYELEWVLGSAMLLPALYLQRKTGEFKYKRDTFALAKKDFSEKEWEPIEVATNLRKALGPRQKPSGLLVRLAYFFGRPAILQQLAKRSVQSKKHAQEVMKVLGKDYPKQVLTLLKEMKEKLSL